MKSNERARNWTFLIYPDSAPSNFFDLLSDLHIPFALSPLHDKDINADGSSKKAHYHLVLLFDGNKSFSQVQEISSLFSNVCPMIVQHIRQMIRYLVHLDSPDKYQYDVSSIRCSGVSIEDLMAKSGSERRSDLRNIVSFIEDNDITEFAQLVRILIAPEYADWFEILTDRNTLFIKEFIKSRKFEKFDLR